MMLLKNIWLYLWVFFCFPSVHSLASVAVGERTCVILYHKPLNVVTTHAGNDVKGRLNVYDDVESMKGYVGEGTPRSLQEATGVCSKWHAIGRLDAETTGLLLLTNDGGLVHHITNKDSSSKPISKTYEAVIMGYHETDDEIFCKLRTDGVDIGAKYGGQTLPVDQVTVLDHPTTKSTLVSLTISEGKNRQVRRMFHALGSGVMRLRRIRIGEKLTLKRNYIIDKTKKDSYETNCMLNEGEWRILSDEEIQICLDFKPRTLVEKSNYPSSRRKKRSNRKTKKFV